MGRVKTKFIKRISTDLFKQNESDFGADFEENKQVAMKLAEFPSKKIRNVVVGYITRLARQNKE